MKKGIPKYSLILYKREEYKRAGKKTHYFIQSNNLEKLLKLAERHTKRYKRNPWEYIHILRNTQFEPYRDNETLLFVNVKK